MNGNVSKFDPGGTHIAGYIDFDSIVAQGLHLAESRYDDLGVSSYNRTPRIITLENVICTENGIFLPSVGKWVLESTLAGNLLHRKEADLLNLLQFAGQKLDQLPPPAPKQSLHKPIVWGSYPWDINYQHFFCETLPRLFLAHNYLPEPQPLSYVVCDRPYIADCLQLIGLPERRLISHKYFGDGVHVDKVHVVAPIYVNMLGMHSPLIKRCIQRMKSCASFNDKMPRNLDRIYIGRRGDANNHGATRVMLNEEEITTVLETRGFHTLYMEELNLTDKIRELSTVRHAIMPIGAGVMNLAFSPNLERLLLLQHPYVNLPAAWFARFLRQFSDVKVDTLNVDVGKIDAGQNKKHAPFTVQSDVLLKTLEI